MENSLDQEKVAHLIEITACSTGEAEFLLEAAGGDLALAVQLYKGAKTSCWS
jgi:hypothetical protein